jgi:putative FmdB family regulatory protein
MPLYQYEREDGTRFDEWQGIHDDPFTECPTTGQPVKRIIGSPMVKFVGQDWDIHRHHRRYTLKQQDKDEGKAVEEFDPVKRKYKVSESAIKERLKKKDEGK